MAELRIRTARHTVRVAAPPRQVYQLIANTMRWPQIFGPTVHVEHLGAVGTTERVRLWDLIDDEVRGFVSHRELNARRMQVRFRREATPDPMASMGGLWMVIPKSTGAVVALDHHYRVVGDNPADAQYLAEVVDRTSAALLASLRDVAEQGSRLDRLMLSCEDSVDIGGDPRDVYDFLAGAEDGVARVCFPSTRIAFKQSTPPATMRAHTGGYSITRLPYAVRATATHMVLLRDESTKDTVRQALRDLSLVALGRAKEFAEARRPVRVGATPR